MRKGKNSPIIPYSAIVKKQKSDQEFTRAPKSKPRINYLQRVIPCPCQPCLVDIRYCDHELSRSHNKRVTDRNKKRNIHYLFKIYFILHYITLRIR